MANPQTHDVSNPEPLWPVNARWVNGVAPGYWPTAGSGLNLNLSAGTAFNSGAIVNYAGGSLALTNNATNYVYLDHGASYAPASNTSGFPAGCVPIAVVVTAGGAITSITDDRTQFVAPTAPGGSNHQTQINSSGAFAGVGPGTAGQYLRSGGASADPAFASIAESEVGGLTSDLAGKVPATRQISTTAPLTGGGDLSADRTLAISNFTGDSGSGGAKGAVPAPAAGDAAAGKFLKADGTWAKPSAVMAVVEDVFTGNGSTTAFTTSLTPLSGFVMVFVGGQRMSGGGVDYTTSGSTAITVTLGTPPASGQKVLLDYFQ